MQENVLKSILSVVEDDHGQKLQYYDLVSHVVRKESTQNRHCSNKNVESVLQLVRQASCFQVNIQQ
jgi:hypothetical protein